jgi:hypothetical protein
VSSANAKTASTTVAAPNGVAAGDVQLLYVTTAGVGVTAPPSGWQQLTQRTNDTGSETTVFWRAVSADAVTAPVTVNLTVSSAVDVELVDYSGVDSASAPPAATAADTNATTHTAPAIAVPQPRSWVVTYWAVKSSNTTTWSLPATVAVRKTTQGTSGGRIWAAVADSGAAVPTGTYGPLAASSTTSAGRGQMVSVVLQTA